MRRLPDFRPTALVLALLLGARVWAAEALPVTTDPVLEQRLILLAQDLRCLVCQNESLAGSRAELAEDLRREIRAQMKAGKSDAEVIDYLTARYGDFVLYRPPVKPATYLLWAGPAVFLALGIGLGWTVLRRHNREDTGSAEAADLLAGAERGGDDKP